MLTLKLWRALNRPPARSPLYRRALVRQYPTERLEWNRIPLVGWFKNLGLIVLPVVLILLGAPILVLLYYLALLIAPLLLPLANTLHGLSHVHSVSGSIAKEREQQTYDVLCTAPAGTMGMHWSYCTGWLHYHWNYRYALLAVLSIGIVASIFGLSPQLIFGGDPASLVTTVIRALTLGTLFVIDYAQSIVLSSLTTMLIPAVAETVGDARLWASSLFLALQMGVYVPTLLFSVFALPGTFRLLGLDATLSDLLIPLLTLAFFMALRELIINELWRRVQDQLGGTAVELDGIIHAAL